MATYWHLDEDVTVTLSAGRAVFLDVARDRYAMLPPALNAAFVDWLGEPGSRMPKACLSALAAKIALKADRVALRPRAVSLTVPCEVPGAKLPAVRPKLGDAVAVARTVARAKRLLARLPLRANLERRRRALDYQPPRRPDPQQVMVKASVYRAVRHLAPVPRVCLLDSLALVDWLSDDLEAVQLVFGITAYPFGAHCWVQTRRALLGDAPDTIGRYAPIFHLG